MAGCIALMLPRRIDQPTGNRLARLIIIFLTNRKLCLLENFAFLLVAAGHFT